MASRSHATRKRLTAAVLAAAGIMAAAALPGCTGTAAGSHPPTAGQVAPTAAGPSVCGQPVLHSPWDYNGDAGTYDTSGTPAGLPTFGAAGTEFPSATSVIVVAAGDNSSAATAADYQVNNTVVYFEPGTHDVDDGMYTGNNSAYVGGYTSGAGAAILDGQGGNRLTSSTASSGNNVYDTWEYLTIENFAASHNNSVMGNVNGGGSDNGDTYEYDTIGPNEYSADTSDLNTTAAPGEGGGYAIDLGSYTTIEYDCLTQNAQGGFNGAGAGIVIANNEITANGLGSYPDNAGPGASSFACGCSGGGKLFYSVNADVVNNWVHGNYDVGIWLDFDNVGADISHNYVAGNWGEGIMYEASYNADISDNTLIGNGWDPAGAWPAGVGGGDCFGSVPCTGGEGPITGAGGGNPYGAIYLPNSGGNSNLSTIDIPAEYDVPGCDSDCSTTSRYAGHLYVEGNNLVNNFGGIKVYTDTNRYPGDIDADSACSIPLGGFDQQNSDTYYQQTKVLLTGADATVSGSSVTSSGGTRTICADYGDPGSSDDSAASATQEPSTGMGVYNQTTGAYLGNVATVTSANAFTLNDSPGNVSGATLLLSAYGGCGPADYFDGAQGTTSGTPAEDYWDNCLWATKNVTVSGNQLSINAGTVTGCTTDNLCGWVTADAFLPGIPTLMQYWADYDTLIGKASGGVGVVFSGNDYTWAGGGPDGWSFEAGDQGNTVSQADWQASPYGQDAGSTFNG